MNVLPWTWCSTFRVSRVRDMVGILISLLQSVRTEGLLKNSFSIKKLLKVIQPNIQLTLLPIMPVCSSNTVQSGKYVFSFLSTLLM